MSERNDLDRLDLLADRADEQGAVPFITSARLRLLVAELRELQVWRQVCKEGHTVKAMSTYSDADLERAVKAIRDSRLQDEIDLTDIHDVWLEFAARAVFEAMGMKHE